MEAWLLILLQHEQKSPQKQKRLYIHFSHWRRRKIEKIYQTNSFRNYFQNIYIDNNTHNGSFCSFDLSVTRDCVWFCKRLLISLNKQVPRLFGFYRGGPPLQQHWPKMWLNVNWAETSKHDFCVLKMLDVKINLSTINQVPEDAESRYWSTSILLPEYLVKVLENQNQGPRELNQGLGVLWSRTWRTKWFAAPWNFWKIKNEV